MQNLQQLHYLTTEFGEVEEKEEPILPPTTPFHQRNKESSTHLASWQMTLLHHVEAREGGRSKMFGLSLGLKGEGCGGGGRRAVVGRQKLWGMSDREEGVGGDKVRARMTGKKRNKVSDRVERFEERQKMKEHELEDKGWERGGNGMPSPCKFPVGPHLFHLITQCIFLGNVQKRPLHFSVS